MINPLRIIIALAVLVVVVAVAGGSAWYFFVRDDAELASNAPEIPTDLRTPPASTPAAGTATAPALPGGATRFVIIPERSEAAYFADEQLARLPLPSTAKGATTDISGEFVVTEDGFDPDNPATFTVDLRTLKSDEERRDNRVQDALETSRFPTATFTATGVEGYDPGAAEGVEQALTLTGTLDIHGVQKEVTWDLKARREGNVITGLATVNFLYADFGITAPNIAGIVSVEDDVTLQVQVVAQAAS